MTDLQFLAMVGLLVYFAVLLVIVTKEKKNDNVLDYFFAGRQLSFWQLSLTFIASWWGAGSAISTADLAYEDGLGAFWYYGVPVLLSAFLMILGAKAIRKVGFLTQGKMLEMRYSKATAKLLSIMILIFMTFSAASQMVGVGSFFGTYLGISYELAVLLGTGIVFIYSLFGGFRGVVLTDIIQFVLLLLSAIAVFVVAMLQAGSLEDIATRAAELGKPDYMSMTAGAAKYMTFVITFGCSWVIQANVWQRISATKSDKDARRMTVMSFFVYIPLYLIVVLTGMAGLTMFDTLPPGGIVPTLVMYYMPPALGALAFVGISAAIMSTMDSLINTGAMTLSIDLNDGEQSEEAKLHFSRWATALVTLVALIISLGIRSILTVTWIASDVITTGVFVPLVAGFIWRRGNAKGVMASMVLGLLYCFYNLLLFFGVNLPAFWEPQTTLQVVIGVALSTVAYVGVSLATEPEYAKADRFIALANNGMEEQEELEGCELSKE